MLDKIWLICTIFVYALEIGVIALMVGVLYQAAVKITKMSKKL